jgi:hypothetical protein
MSIDSDAALGWLTFILRQFSLVAQFCWLLLFFLSAFPSADSLPPRLLRDRRPKTNDDALESQEEQLLKNCTNLIKPGLNLDVLHKDKFFNHLNYAKVENIIIEQ